jgi:hypothetical protein
MIVDLEERETENGWFDLPGGGRVHLRLLSRDELHGIRKKTLAVVPEYPLIEGEYRRFEGREFNEELFDELWWDKSIVEWKDILDKNGAPIPVSAENKALLMRRVSGFVEAVDAGLKELKQAEKEKSEASIKN